MLIVMEGLVLCFFLLLTCVVGTANGPAGLVVLYEPDVQERAIALGYTTRKKLRKSLWVTAAALYVPVLVFLPAMVYTLNDVHGFWDGVWQMTLAMWIMGLFDRLFIDWYWVERTKAWIIPGAEDLRPYIPRKMRLLKWFATIVGFPLMAAAVAGIMTLL